jgi:hypothetical protein
MKKTIKLILFVGLIAGVIQPAYADAPSKPVVASFTMTPDTVDVATASTLVSFTLVVSNPTGIASANTQVTLSDGGSNSLSTTLTRADSPQNNSLSTVTFRGTITLPSNISNGAYFATANPITGMNADGSNGYSTEILYATTTSKVVGAEDALLVRKNGDLNYSYGTFHGPSYNNISGTSFTNPKFNTVTAPIWKVGESFNPSDYFELNVPGLALKIAANSSAICSTNGSMLQLIGVGACSFTVFTDKTLDYQKFTSEQVVNVTAARTKPVYTVGSIATQSSAKLPLSIAGPFVYGPFGLLTPVTATPIVCYPVGTFITVISGGTCTLNYSSPANATYLASDVFPLTFEITRTAQSLTFTAPTSATLSSKTLSLGATASSGGSVTNNSNSPSICSVTGSSLNLLASGTCQVEALQAGSATILPASAIQSIVVTGSRGVVNKIVCVKSGRSKTFTGAKCPSGYRVKK